MIDAHIHIECGTSPKEQIYTPEWIRRYADAALLRGVNEIYLLEHSYRFREFLPMYEGVRARSDYIGGWLSRKAGVLRLDDFLRLADAVRGISYPVGIKFGLEVCYFRESEGFVRELTGGTGLDFLVGSVHFIDGFAFDHKKEHWEGRDTDGLYRRYFETSVGLADSAVFDGLAHPDCIRLFGHRPSFPLTEYYRALVASLKRSGMYAEQNSGASRRTGCRPGMDGELLGILREYGVEIKTASDAHTPEDTGRGIREMHDDLYL